jgi:hypothetical protein
MVLYTRRVSRVVLKKHAFNNMVEYPHSLQCVHDRLDLFIHSPYRKCSKQMLWIFKRVLQPAFGHIASVYYEEPFLRKLTELTELQTKRTLHRVDRNKRNAPDTPRCVSNVIEILRMVQLKCLTRQTDRQTRPFSRTFMWGAMWK